MIDRNKLNRIKGVLSARAGAEIPKFQGGAKFTRHKGTQTIYSNDNISWFLDLDLTAPFEGDINEFKDVSNNLPALEIPGDPKLTPTTGVENATKKIANLEKAKEEIEINDIAASYELPEVVVTAKKLNTPPLKQDAEYNDKEGEEGEENDSEKKPLISEKTAGKIGEYATKGLQMAGEYFGAKQAATDSSLTKGADALYDTAADAVKKMGPVGLIVGTAMGFAGTAGDIIQGLGGGTDQMTTTDKWMDSSFFSWNIGMLNGFGGKRSDAFTADQDILASVGSSYGGTTEDINNAASKASKKYGLFSSGSRRKANRQIALARAKQNLMGDISDEATDLRLAVLSMGELAGLAYSLMTDGGYSLKYTYAAKLGGVLEWIPEIELDLEWHPQIDLNWELPEFKEGGNFPHHVDNSSINYLKWKPVITEYIEEFKEGGKTKEESDIPEIEETTQKNVIPEGALHKNKHHMEHAEGLTKKGIPVIDEDGEQLAEIEHSEIIFTLEVTKKLEEYYNTFYSESSSNKEKEQAALDAGKLLVYQILENTEDRTGLIESCKKGGSLTLKKSTDDLIEEVLEWMPTIVIVEETIKESKEEKSDKSEKKPEKDLIKLAIKEVLIELLTQ